MQLRNHAVLARKNQANNILEDWLKACKLELKENETILAADVSPEKGCLFAFISSKMDDKKAKFLFTRFHFNDDKVWRSDKTFFQEDESRVKNVSIFDGKIYFTLEKNIEGAEAKESKSVSAWKQVNIYSFDGKILYHSKREDFLSLVQLYPASSDQFVTRHHGPTTIYGMPGTGDWLKVCDFSKGQIEESKSIHSYNGDRLQVASLLNGDSCIFC